MLEVEGMKCGGCVQALKSALESVNGVEHASVNLATGTASIDIASDAALDACIEKSISVGFPARERPQSLSMQAEAEQRSNMKVQKQGRASQLATAWLLSGSCIALHVTHHQSMHTLIPHFIHSPAVSCALTTAAFAGPGREIIQEGFSAVRYGRPDMNTLVGTGALLAYGLSLLGWLNPSLAVSGQDLFHEPAMLLGFVLLGRTLEENARDNATSEIESLAKLLPPDAQLVRYDDMQQQYIEQERAPVDLIGRDQLVQVLPGEKASVDGTIVEGECEVDESALTGEPMRVAKQYGDAVNAGTVVYGKRVILKADAVGAETKAANVRRLVEDAQARPSHSQRLADRVAGQFSVGILSAAAATFAFWCTAGVSLFPDAPSMLGLNGSMPLAARLAADVTVVACPCALGLATPTAVLVGTSVGSRLGLLIKGGDVLDALARIDYACIDKTGTLTHSMPSISAAFPLNDAYSKGDVTALAAALESESTHPLAKAILTAACYGTPGDEEKTPMIKKYNDVQWVETFPGKGIQGTVDGVQCYLGSEAFVLNSLGIECDRQKELSAQVSELLSNEDSAVIVGRKDHGVVGILAVRDEIRAGAVDAVERLRSQGLQVMVLSGDRQEVVEAVSSRMGASAGPLSQMTPEGKAAVVRKLQDEQGFSVMAVGDGINDAPALAEARVGVAMRGGLGAAESAADVVLMRDDLSAAADAIDVGRRTSAKIRNNLLWAVGYNLVSVPVAAGALLPSFGYALDPSIAGLAMALSSVAVVTNSLLLRSEWFGVQSVLPSPSRSIGWLLSRLRNLTSTDVDTSIPKEQAELEQQTR